MADKREPKKDDKKAKTVTRLEELAEKYSKRVDLPSAPESTIIERIGEIMQQKESMTQEQQDIAAGAQGLDAKRHDVAMIQQDKAELDKKKKELEIRGDNLEKVRIETAARQFAANVGTATSTTNLTKDVNTMAGSTAMIGPALKRSEMPTFKLEEDKKIAFEKVTKVGEAIRETVAKTPDDTKKIDMLTEQLGSQIKSAALATAAINMQVKQGTDVKNRFVSTSETQEKLEKIIESKDLSKQVASGQFGTRKEVEQTLRQDVNQIQKFREAQLRHSEDPVTFERFQKAIDKLTDSAGKAAGVLAEMGRQGTGMGGVADFFSNKKVQGGMQIVQAASQLGAAVLDTWTYQNPLRQRQNETTFANLNNRQFDDTLAAMGGDMGALRRLGSSYKAGEDVNSTAKTGSKASTGLQTLGSVAGVGLALAGGIASATGIGASIGVPMIMGGLALAGVANTAAGNYNQQAGERGSTIAQAEIQRRDALSKIDDFTAQSFVNMSKGLGAATVGLGGGFGGVPIPGGGMGASGSFGTGGPTARSTFTGAAGTIGTPAEAQAEANRRGGTLRESAFQQLSSKDMVARLAAVGIAPEQTQAMVAAGVQTLGREFNPNMLVHAGQIRQAGIMGEGQTIQSMGALSMVGGNAAGNLEEILRNAVANGMDNSKSIAQMVEATTSLASKSAAAGVDVASGAAASVGKIMDQLEEQGTPINMRGAVAQNSLNFANEALGSKSLNLNNIAEWQQMSKALPGATGAQLRRVSSLRAEEFEQLRGPNGAAFAKQIGVDNLVTDENGKIDPSKMKELQKIEFTKLVNTVMPRGMNEEARKSAIQAGSFEEFQRSAKPAEMRDFMAIASEKGINLGGTLSIAGPGGPSKAAVPTVTAGGAGETDKLKVTEAQGQAKAVEQGRDIVDALGGLKGLTSAIEGIAKNFDPGKMSEGVKEAAKSFETGPINKFDKAVDRLINKLDQVDGRKK